MHDKIGTHRLRDGECATPYGIFNNEPLAQSQQQSCGCPPIVPLYEDKPTWFPIRVTYCRELKLKAYLDMLGIVNFLPMRYAEGVGIHKGRKRLVPTIHNLLFVQSTRAKLDELKHTNELAATMRYIIDPATKRPAEISESEMRHFMQVSQTLDEGLIYFAEEEVQWKNGDRCRITGGMFAGVEGELIRIRGDRRIVVKLQGFMAVATAFIHPKDLEKI